MTDDFESAVAAASTLSRDPGAEVKLRLYALYKQATLGDVTGKRPGLTNVVGRAKHDAWAKAAGMSPEDARSAYVAEVGRLQAEEG